MAAVFWAWCFPSFLCFGLVAGEAVKLRRAPFYSFASLAGRGGEGRSWGWTASRFCCRWFSVVPFGGFAPAGRGGEGSSFWRWCRVRAGGGVGVVGVDTPPFCCPFFGSDASWGAGFGQCFQLTCRRGAGRCPRRCCFFVAKVPLFTADDTCGAPTRLVLYSTEQAAQRLFIFVSCWISGDSAARKISAADCPREAPRVFCVFPLSQGPFCKSGQLYSFWMFLMFI
jgi:hypothetical protein